MRNSSLVESSCADNVTGLSIEPKPRLSSLLLGVEEHSVGSRSQPERVGGSIRRENAGMSNEKGGEIPPRRKPKVSWVKVVFPGLVGP